MPFNQLGFSRLFAGYARSASSITPYYARDWRSAADRAQAVADAATRPRDRQTLVEVLRRQHASWGSDELAAQNIERLLDPDSAVVITGQQVGLFTGPLYTVLKALSTIKLAAELEKETGRPVVPMFWLGAEDHDFVEMAGTGLPGPDGLVDCRYAGHVLPENGNLGPVGPLEFTDDIQRIHEEIEALLQPTDFRDGVMELVRDTYAAGATFQDGFARLLRALLPDQGLVLIASGDHALKRLAAPLWRREIEDWESVTAALERVSAKLEEQFHAQVHVRPTNLFFLQDGQRLPLDASKEGFTIRGTDIRYSSEQLLALLETEPERFSPNVVMRPLTQDWLLPTAAYVAGPGETAYFAQYRPAYEWAGIPMPVIYPRASITLVEGRIRKALTRVGRSLEAFSGDPEALFSETVKEQLSFDLDARFGQAKGELSKTVGSLKTLISQVDPSLGKTVEATRASLFKELDRLQSRVVRSERRRQEELKAQINKIREALFPGGTPQERAVSPLYFLNKYGPNFFVQLKDRLPMDTGEHVVIDL